MAFPIRSILVPRRTLAASSTVQFEMGVNPISHLDLLFIATYNGAQQGTMLNVAAQMVTNCRVLWKGMSAYDLSLRDSMATAYFLHGKVPQINGTPATASFVGFFGTRIPFGRTPYNPVECLPETRRGDLLLEIVTGALPAQLTSLEMLAIQHELPGATPGMWLRSATHQRTPTAVGDVDVDLPMGGVMTGLGLFSTTVPTGAATTTTINQARILIENKETFVASASWFDLKYIGKHNKDWLLDGGDHVHVENLAVGYTQFANSGLPSVPSSVLANYAYMDLDPDGTGQYALDLRTPNQPQCRVNAGDTNIFRLLSHNLQVLE